MDISQISQGLLDSVKLQATEIGMEMKGDSKEVQDYIEQRLPLVAMAISEPGFMEILKVEANNLLLKSSLLAVDRADAIDSRLRDMATGALHMAVRVAIA